MRVLDPGHAYELSNLDGSGSQSLVFVKRFRGEANHEGTWNQEVLRVLIHRTLLLNEEVESKMTDEIIYHLRMALILHESRALARKVHKGEMKPEDVSVSPKDGHFVLAVS